MEGIFRVSGDSHPGSHAELEMGIAFQEAQLEQPFGNLDVAHIKNLNFGFHPGLLNEFGHLIDDRLHIEEYPPSGIGATHIEGTHLGFQLQDMLHSLLGGKQEGALGLNLIVRADDQLASRTGRQIDDHVALGPNFLHGFGIKFNGRAPAPGLGIPGMNMHNRGSFVIAFIGRLRDLGGGGGQMGVLFLRGL
jgi:hypothetical protein